VVSELCTPDALPALVHCNGGKDRTGLVIGLILSALGVHDDDVARDYSLTADNLGADFFRDLNHHNARVDLTSLMGSDAAVMLQALGLVRELAGDASTYLTTNGVARGGPRAPARLAPRAGVVRRSARPNSSFSRTRRRTG
jgi:protein-tyrosine phosphatase